jgi:hypothetical protein
MKGANIISAIQHLRMAEEYYVDFRRQYPGSKGSALFKTYIDKIKWIYRDFLTNPNVDDDIRSGLKKELESDVFAIPAITEKISLLMPEQREIIESTIDAMLDGEEVKIVDINETK